MWPPWWAITNQNLRPQSPPGYTAGPLGANIVGAMGLLGLSLALFGVTWAVLRGIRALQSVAPRYQAVILPYGAMGVGAYFLCLYQFIDFALFNH